MNLFDDQWYESAYQDPETGEMKFERRKFEELPEQEQRSWYEGVCSNSEIERILHIQNASDYILKLRADEIIDHTRIWRYFLKLSRYYGQEWSLERYFSAKNYVIFKHALNRDKQEKLEQVSYGSLLCNEPNGLIFSSPYGICSVYSTSLRYFSMFSNLALLDCDGKVPPHVSFNVLRIAARLMLGTESLDFEMDPRGIIPQNVSEIIRKPFPFQSIFLAGHEYSHYLLGHLDDKKTQLRGLNRVHFKDDTDYKKINAYTIDQKHEFAADLGAMNEPLFEEDYYETYYFYTLLWFAALSVFEAVEDTMFPPIGHQSHPGAIARYNNIIEHARRPKRFDEKLFLEELPSMIDFYRQLMIEDCQIYADEYERYGSVYLDAPNTEWRGQELIDRKDY